MIDKVLPRDITSYDLLKTFAVITMIIDHIGIYMFPDEDWWRCIGRLSFPCWLFLIGYAQSRDISTKLIVAAAIVVVSNIFAGQGVFPLNILVAIIVVRYFLDTIMRVLLTGPAYLWGGSVLLFIIALPSFIVFEFGAQAFLFAIFGYLVRYKNDKTKDQPIFSYAIFIGFTYVFLQAFGYALFDLKFVVLAFGVAAVMYALYGFQLKTYPVLTAKTFDAGVSLIQICGRRTLEIYVLHLLLFKAVALYMGTKGFEFLNWSWVW